MLDLELLCRDLKRSRSPIRKTGNTLILQLFTILNHPTSETKQLFTQWTDEFQSIYGDIHLTLSCNRKLDTSVLLREFGIIQSAQGDSHDVLMLFFSIQTFFSLLLKQITRHLLDSPSIPPDALITHPLH